MVEEKSTEAMIEDFAFAISLVVRRIRANAPAELQDLSWTQTAVLKRLDKDGPATTAELARAEGVKPQSMATAVASLEKLGMLKRRAHPTDGRQMNLKLTAKGAALRRRLQKAKRNWLGRAFSGLTKQEQGALFHAGDILKQMAEEMPQT
jgi:DNA-binding MarR family transcriptional regulator